MSTLTQVEIDSRLRSSESGKQLVITPLLSGKQVGKVSVDVRLGNQFIIFRPHAFSTFDPFDKTQSLATLHQMQERRIVSLGTPFVLHPHSIALGATLEYVSIPPDIECQVEGRSSWARLGLQVATATTVEPLFRGVITLELSNVGTIPIKLYPGVRIAQLVFRIAKPPVEEPFAGKYLCPIGPQFSKLAFDRDGHLFAGNQAGGDL
jgi:dCTP deaminase